VIVAVAALIIFGVFSDTIRGKLAGAVQSIDGGDHATDATDAVATKSVDVLKSLDTDKPYDGGSGSGS
jgi:hypothetical protein